jgi:serine/threonine protein kinase SCH9
MDSCGSGHRTDFHSDVRDTSLPLEFSLFDRGNSDAFLGRGRLLPSAGSWVGNPVWVPLEGREDFEKVTGKLEVAPCFLENGPKLCSEDFDFRHLSATLSKSNVYSLLHCRSCLGVYEKRDNGLTFTTKAIEDSRNERPILRRNTRADGFVRPLKFIFSQSLTQMRLFVDKAKGEHFSRVLEKNNYRLEETSARFYLAEIILALQDLRECDSRPLYFTISDIYLDSLGHMAFIDFNVSVVKVTGNVANERDLEYMAPEVVLGGECHRNTDFWSLGVIMFTICYSSSPFWEVEPQRTIMNICHKKPRFPRNSEGKAGRNLVEDLLNKDPNHRLVATHGIEELRNHPFFEEIDWVKLRRRDVIPPFKPEAPCSERFRFESATHKLKTPAYREDEQNVPQSFEFSHGSLSSYRTAQSSFGPPSVYGTPASYPDIWYATSSGILFPYSDILGSFNVFFNVSGVLRH